MGHSLLFHVQFHKGQWFRDFGANVRLKGNVLTKFLTVVTLYDLFFTVVSLYYLFFAKTLTGFILLRWLFITVESKNTFFAFFEKIFQPGTAE